MTAAAQPNPPSAERGGAALPQLDPNMVLTRVQQSGELGAALVREAVARCYAEHYAAENEDLRAQLAKTDGDTAGSVAGDPAGEASSDQP